MTTSAIREKLYNYIKVADEKKVWAIYMILEDEITAETEWYKDAAFVKELDVQYNAWKKKSAKAYSLEEADKMIKQKRAKK